METFSQGKRKGKEKNQFHQVDDFPLSLLLLCSLCENLSATGRPGERVSQLSSPLSQPFSMGRGGICESRKLSLLSLRESVVLSVESGEHPHRESLLFVVFLLWSVMSSSSSH
jgi:hypothetical protein